MLIVSRQGYGLGNQLFQYATGRYFAHKYQAPLKIAVDPPSKRSSYGHPRPFLLNKFAISAPCEPITTLDRLLMSTSPKLEIPARPIKAGLRIQVIRDRHPQTFIFDRDLEIPVKTQIAYLVGVWACFPPAQLVENQLRQELGFRDEPIGRNQELARLIQCTPNAVSLHIRRGDYLLAFPEWVLPEEYYLQAMRRMTDRLGNPTFFLFSDDPVFAHQFAAMKENCIVVDQNNAESAHEDLRLMSLCRHHIIANSTFSWWGAWLDSRKDKTVMVPRKWLRVETSKVEIALPDWILV